MVFLRDRGAVFFSLLSMLIVLMLMGVFLGNMNEEHVVYLLEEYGGIRDIPLDEAHAKELVQYWTLAGILVVNAVTVTLTVTEPGIGCFRRETGKPVCRASQPGRDSFFLCGFCHADWDFHVCADVGSGSLLYCSHWRENVKLSGFGEDFPAGCAECRGICSHDVFFCHVR